ncbi:hypothetical protein TNCV_3825631 [Trichonephila clavipes]|nr:hypothetical protein TNCV_3825631 [Trichonephila clavipes]
MISSSIDCMGLGIQTSSPTLRASPILSSRDDVVSRDSEGLGSEHRFRTAYVLDIECVNAPWSSSRSELFKYSP